MLSYFKCLLMTFRFISLSIIKTCWSYFLSTKQKRVSQTEMPYISFITCNVGTFCFSAMKLWLRLEKDDDDVCVCVCVRGGDWGGRNSTDQRNESITCTVHGIRNKTHKSRKKIQTSFRSYAQPAQPGPIRRLGLIRSDSVIKLVSVVFGKCTTLVVMKG